MSSCYNTAKCAFSNGLVNSSYISDYLRNKKSKLENCNARKTIRCKKGFTQGQYLLYNNEQLRRNGIHFDHVKLHSGLHIEKNFEGLDNVCKYGAESGGVVACTSPTTIDTGLLPFYSYYKINSSKN